MILHKFKYKGKLIYDKFGRPIYWSRDRAAISPEFLAPHERYWFCDIEKGWTLTPLIYYVNTGTRYNYNETEIEPFNYREIRG